MLSSSQLFKISRFSLLEKPRKCRFRVIKCHRFFSPVHVSVPERCTAYNCQHQILCLRKTMSTEKHELLVGCLNSNDIKPCHDGSLVDINQFFWGIADSPLTFQRDLCKCNIMCRKAHAKLLARQGFLQTQDLDVIFHSLNEIEELIEAGIFQLRQNDKDVHLSVGAALLEHIGESPIMFHGPWSLSGKEIEDLKTWCLQSADEVENNVKQLQAAFGELAQRSGALVVPCFNSCQDAEPIVLQLQLLSLAQKLNDDVPLIELYKDILILRTSGQRSDDEKHSNMWEVVAAYCDIIANPLLKFIEVSIWWLSKEFVLLLPRSTGLQSDSADQLDRLSMSSSELLDDLSAFYVLYKETSGSLYQELPIKERLAGKMTALVGFLQSCTEFVSRLSFDWKSLQGYLCNSHIDAYTLVDYLMMKGVEESTSMQIAAKAVALCNSRKCHLEDLQLDEFRQLSSHCEEDVYDSLGSLNAILWFCCQLEQLEDQQNEIMAQN